MNARLLPAGPPAPPAIRWLGVVVDYTLVTMGAVMAVLVFCNVLMHLFHQDIAWTTELCEFMMVWVTFLGGASAARRGAHMTITEFIDKLTGKSRLKADAAVQVLCLAVLLLLVWYGIGHRHGQLGQHSDRARLAHGVSVSRVAGRLGGLPGVCRL